MPLSEINDLGDKIMTNLYLLEQSQLQDNRQTQIELKLRVPQNYHQEPIISQLISEYQLQVIFLAAILGKDGQGDGWFDLELFGTSQQINNALIYLSELDVELWHEQDLELDGW
jgi:ABC-type methionine transport system ATPase subunit